jgi:hypothetical protein
MLNYKTNVHIDRQALLYNSLKKSGPLNSQLTKLGNKTPSIRGVAWDVRLGTSSIARNNNL